MHCDRYCIYRSELTSSNLVGNSLCGDGLKFDGAETLSWTMARDAKAGWLGITKAPQGGAGLAVYRQEPQEAQDLRVLRTLSSLSTPSLRSI